MAKQASLAFVIGDWLKDPLLSLCSPATRGVWMDLICGLHELGQGGQVTANVQQIARLCRCSDADAHAALNELQLTGAADISEREGKYTVICRRMKRAADLTAKRQLAGSKSHGFARARPISVNNREEEVRTEIEEYCTSLGLPSTDGTAVYNKWVGNGWTNGGKPIRDWKATIRSWKDYGYLPSQKNEGRNGQQREFSAFEIEKRLDAITAELNALYQAQKQSRSPERETEINRLKARRIQLQSQLIA